MKRRYATLTEIKHNRPITKDNHAKFLYILQNGLLMALKEQGILNLMQYRQGLEKLREQNGKGRGL